MKALDTTITGQITVSLPATQPTQVVRLGELQTLLGGYLPTGSVFVAAQITDLASAMPTLMANVLADTGGFFAQQASGVVNGYVRLRAGGGLSVASDGLFVNWTNVSRPGHTHTLADITDFNAQLPGKVQAILAPSPTLAWQWTGAYASGVVQVQPGGGILAGAAGLYADVGTGATQLAAGNHTHALLHSPFTIEASQSLAWSLAGQDLTAEVRLAPGGALVSGPSGVAVALGTTHGTAAYGDHTHALLHNPVAVVATPSVVLTVDGSQNLSANVQADPAPPAGCAPVTIGSAGLYLQLGTAINQPAAGTHGHAVVVANVSDGFMSKGDKALFNQLVPLISGVGLVQAVQDTQTVDLTLASGVLSAVVRVKTGLNPNQGALSSDVAGMFVPLASGVLSPLTQANVAASGNHTHAAPTGSGLVRVVAGVTDGAAHLVVNADVDPAAGIAEAKLALNYATHSNANDPTAGQAAALAGTSGIPGNTNRYVTVSDTRLTHDVVVLRVSNGSSPLAGGEAEFFVAPWSGVVTGWDLMAGQSGTLQLDIKRSSLPSFPPITSIAGSELPLISGGRLAQNLSLTTWASGGAFAPNDCLMAVVVAADGVIKTAQVQLRVTRR